MRFLRLLKIAVCIDQMEFLKIIFIYFYFFCIFLFLKIIFKSVYLLIYLAVPGLFVAHRTFNFLCSMRDL